MGAGALEAFSMKRLLFGAFFLFLFGIGYEYALHQGASGEAVRFDVLPGESAAALGEKLEDAGVVKSATFFRLFAGIRGIDRRIQAGTYTVQPPVTLARVLATLGNPERRGEKTITIIPGWDLRDIAEYLEQEGVASSTEFYRIAGEPARLKIPAYQDLPSVLSGKPSAVSLEGYLAPNTYRIFADATGEDIIQKLAEARAGEWDSEMLMLLAASKRTMHDVLTMASIVEREVRGSLDRREVADIFWRRLDAGWGLQADSTVHYAVGKKGDEFTTKDDRGRDIPWNTYKYAGLPPGPISNPSVESIRAALQPEENNFWYFLTTLEGDVKYAKTIEEHNRNVARYLR
jgi:UPF0755 protein